MKTSFRAITLSALSCMAGTALAQPEGTYVSGLLHQPVGAATFGPADDRRLPVHNLGSSGQDGVEIQFNSVQGGGVGIDLSTFINTPGAELRNRQKGWDGLIYGTHRMINNGGGQFTDVYDFSAINAPTINVQQVDPNGTVISNTNYPGPILAIPVVPNWHCSDGSTPIYVEFWVVLCSNGCNPVLFQGWACPNSGTVHAFQGMSRTIVTPGSGPGSPPLPPTGSMVVTGVGMPDLTVYDAQVQTFGLQAWGVGGAHIAETCTDPACTSQALTVSNIGSSGQDGVEIDLGDNAGGVSVSLRKDGCCPGHVTLMKLTDDADQEQRVSKTITDISPDGSTDEAIDADFSALGSHGFVLTCYGPGGVVIGPVGGTDTINGGPRPIWTNRCPDGGTEIWTNTGTQSNPVWTFQGCEVNNNMTLPNGTVLTGVSSYTITPLNPTTTPSGKLRHVVITKNGSELELRGVVVTPPVPHCGTADFNGDGDLGTDADIQAFFACLAGSCCPTCGSADFNADGDLGTDADIESFFRVLGGGPC